jgi:hypothetical protein
MFSKNVFLTWVLASALLVTAGFWAVYAGIAGDVWRTDQTHVTSLIGLVFVLVWLKLGSLARQVDAWSVQIGALSVLKRLKRETRVGFFYGIYCFSLGIIGTVVGFIIMLKATFSGNVSDPAVQATLLPTVGTHYATALYCTAAGIISGCILQPITYLMLTALEAKEDA